MKFDLVIRNGRVVDPSQSIDEELDVAISEGRIAKIDRKIPARLAKRDLDATGRLVTPGLIDMHAHLYHGATKVGVDADRFCLRNGVTTAVDAGTSGAFNVEGFRRFVATRKRTRILAFLNIVATGLLSLTVPWESYPELTDVPQAIEALKEHPKFLVGLKVRTSQWQLGPRGLDVLMLARQAAEEAKVPLMVHIGAAPPLCDVLSQMRTGDFLTHCYTSLKSLAWTANSLEVAYEPKGTGKTILDANGKVSDDVWSATERGVKLDVGHGLNSFDADIYRESAKQGLTPDSISSDIHRLNVNAGSGCELLTVMSKFLALGMSLMEVIRRTTINPARLLGRDEELGSFKPRSSADVAVLNLVERNVEFTDCKGKTFLGRQELVACHTIRNGTVVWSNDNKYHGEKVSAG